MKGRKCLIAVILTLMTMGYPVLAWGAVSPEEAGRLGGPVLTPIGAERAGNKDGTIPEWTGVPITIPREYIKGSGHYTDPFADEKPLFSINSKNMNQYADKLADGVKEFMRRYPDYRIDVYKTHRTMVYPRWLYDNTKKNATACETTNDGRTLTGKGCHGGTPFPIPKAGIDLYWNHSLGFGGAETTVNNLEAYNITSYGRASLVMSAYQLITTLWHNPDHEGDWRTSQAKVLYNGPARRNGEGVVLTYPLDWATKGSIIWSYLPGQRRVRLAPDICCDTPSSGTGGASTWDDTGVFNGDPGRFNWKIIGKKEMYVPYNAYKLVFYKGDINKAILTHHMNPDLVRWELHRVWIVEATLKPDKRHVYGRRIFYADEDTWFFLMADNYDRNGNLYRMSLLHPTYSYDVQATFADYTLYYDLVSKAYSAYKLPRQSGGLQYMKNPPESYFSPDTLAGSGLR